MPEILPAPVSGGATGAQAFAQVCGADRGPATLLAEALNDLVDGITTGAPAESMEAFVRQADAVLMDAAPHLVRERSREEVIARALQVEAAALPFRSSAMPGPWFGDEGGAVLVSEPRAPKAVPVLTERDLCDLAQHCAALMRHVIACEGEPANAEGDGDEWACAALRLQSRLWWRRQLRRAAAQELPDLLEMLPLVMAAARAGRHTGAPGAPVRALCDLVDAVRAKDADGILLASCAVADLLDQQAAAAAQRAAGYVAKYHVKREG